MPQPDNRSPALDPAMAAMMKLLARSDAPPMHPAAEELLLQGNHADEPTDNDFLVPNRGNTVFDMKLCESIEEQQLVDLLEKGKPGSTRWLVPQAPLDLLAASAQNDIDTDEQRRCDFLFSSLGNTPVIFEVDGSQHQTATGVDHARDRAASNAGIETVRVPTQELRDDEGNGLGRVFKAVQDASGRSPQKWHPLVWGPIQTHRLVLGICEALDAGYVSGDCWVIEVLDPTGLSPGLLGPYLELLAAVLTIWDSDHIPQTVVIRAEDSEVLYQRDNNENGFVFTRTTSVNGASPQGKASVTVLLQSDWTPAEKLPENNERHDGTPRIVIRSTGVPLRPKDKPLRRLHPIPRPNLPSEDQTKRAALETVMHAVFAIRQFRDRQYEALRLALTGQDCAVLLPTGAGKSMIFQLTGLIIVGRVVIVAPLVSLIEDQLRGLKQNGIDRAHGISHASNKDAQDFKEAADAYFLYITPERFQRGWFRDKLVSVARSFPVCLAAVDEAHCVSEWGHDFRHAYLNLGKTIRTRCDPSGRNPPPIVALTGTASRAVLTDVLFQLGIDGSDPDSVISPSSFDRPEIDYEVRLAKPDISNAVLEDVLHCLVGDFSDHLNSGNEPLPGIVFIPTVTGYHGSAETLKTVKNVFPKAVSCSTKPPKDYQDYRAWQAQKDRNVERFMTDEAEVIVSTKAFGMGIDKPNVRWVVHFGMPQSIESFYQEVGRAGRDGKQAKSIIVLSEINRAQNEKLLNPTRSADAQRTSRPWRQRDDIDTVLYFHNQSEVTPRADAEATTKMYDDLSRNTVVPLGAEQEARNKSKRALHRLAVLGVIDDYLISGYKNAEKAEVAIADVSAREIARNLVDFVGRSQPGRVTEIEADLPTFSTRREAVGVCAKILARVVNETIGLARRRSLYEMWELAGLGTEDGEAVRRGVLEYLSEGVPSAVAQQLAERRDFAFSDWIEEWEKVSDPADARYWRAAAARLLGSYPDHPGLLASRAIAGAFYSETPSFDRLEAEMTEAMTSALERYRADPSDVETMVQWILNRFITDGPRHLGEAAAVIAAARVTLPSREQIDKWLTKNYHRSPHLGVFLLAEGIDSALKIAEQVTASLPTSRKENP